MQRISRAERRYAGKAEGKTLLEARGLSKAFRGVQALAEVDLECGAARYWDSWVRTAPANRL